MNIFVLDEDPQTAARYHCDKHVVKMVLETAQILCTVAHQNGVPDVPYRATHKNHPCVIWAGQSLDNYFWLLDLGKALAKEYTARYGKTHKSGLVLEWCELNFPDLPETGLTPFALAMPDEYRGENPVASYRAYYEGEKKGFASWREPGKEPSWWGASF